MTHPAQRTRSRAWHVTPLVLACAVPGQVLAQALPPPRPPSPAAAVVADSTLRTALAVQVARVLADAIAATVLDTMPQPWDFGIGDTTAWWGCSAPRLARHRLT